MTMLAARTHQKQFVGRGCEGGRGRVRAAARAVEIEPLDRASALVRRLHDRCQLLRYVLGCYSTSQPC